MCNNVTTKSSRTVFSIYIGRCCLCHAAETRNRSDSPSAFKLTSVMDPQTSDNIEDDVCGTMLYPSAA